MNRPIYEGNSLQEDDCLDFRPIGQWATKNDGCKGPVDYRDALSATGVHHPRCDKHWELALDSQAKINETYPDSPIAPSWFDPANAGESWDEI